MKPKKTDTAISQAAAILPPRDESARSDASTKNSSRSHPAQPL